MSKHYMDIAFTPGVKASQAANGSRDAYAKLETSGEAPDVIGEIEAAFISARDSFYMATISETGWPYLQHRGGPPGFVKILGPHMLGIADFRGNRQYVSLGNAQNNDRVSLFFMDYPNRRRFKLYARMTPVDLVERPEIAEVLIDDDYGAKVERGLIFEVEAFDWNCPQHITPRFTSADIEPQVATLKQEIAFLEAEVARLKS